MRKLKFSQYVALVVWCLALLFIIMGVIASNGVYLFFALASAISGWQLYKSKDRKKHGEASK